MATNTLSTTLDSENLEISKSAKVKSIILAIVLFLSSFFIYFPLDEILVTKLTALSSGIAGCPLRLQGQKISFLPPGIKIPQASMPAACVSPTFGHGDLNIEDFSFQFGGLHFGPFGPKFSLEANLFRTDWKVNIVPSLTESFIELKDQKIRLQPVLSQLRAGIELQGDLISNSNLVIKNATGISKLNLNLKSNNFIIPSQSISGLRIPTLNIGNLSLRAKLADKNIYIIDELLIGTSTSPLRAKFKGTMTPNPMGILFSQLDLQGEFAISPELKKQFPLIEMFIQKFTLLNGFYQLKIQGTLAGPQFL